MSRPPVALVATLGYADWRASYAGPAPPDTGSRFIAGASTMAAGLCVLVLRVQLSQPLSGFAVPSWTA